MIVLSLLEMSFEDIATVIIVSKTNLYSKKNLVRLSTYFIFYEMFEDLLYVTTGNMLVDIRRLESCTVMIGGTHLLLITNHLSQSKQTEYTYLQS